MEQKVKKEEVNAAYRPRLTFYHANARGTGCAMQMDLHPAHDNKSGCIMLHVANQKSVGDRKAPNPTFARFDWDNKISVKLGFDDLCKMLQVFRGECESIENGKGLYHATARATTRICLRHMLEPLAGYSVEVYRVPRDGSAESRAHILLTPAESLGLCESIAGSMSVICFGIPVVLPHETSAYENEQREFRDGQAA